MLIPKEFLDRGAVKVGREYYPKIYGVRQGVFGHYFFNEAGLEVGYCLTAFPDNNHIHETPRVWSEEFLKGLEWV